MNMNIKLPESFTNKLRIVWAHIALILIVAPMDGNQYFKSARILDFPEPLAIASAILIVALALYAAFYLPMYMQVILLVCIIIFSATAYVPVITKLVEETAIVELPNIKAYVEPDANLRVASKNETYLQVIREQNENIKEVNDLEKERVRNLNIVRKTNAVTKSISVAIMVFVFAVLLPFSLFLAAHKLAERLKFIETMEIKRNYSLQEMRNFVTSNSMAVENSLARLEENVNATIQKFKDESINKIAVLSSSPQDARRREREQKTRALLREVEMMVRADTQFSYKGLATQFKMDRETVTKIIKEAAKTMPELQAKLPSIKTNT